MKRVDVLIAGGGVVGSACAWFLRREAPHLSVLVLEPDPAYRQSASTLSAGSIRQQFSTPLNIALSRFGLHFLRQHGIHVHEATYLYLATAQGEAALRANTIVQRNCGVPVRWHDADALARLYPWLATHDLCAGADTLSGEGWFDGHALLRFFREVNERSGVRYLKDRLATLELADPGAQAGLASGERIAARYLVNATGTHSREVAAMAGIDLPVEPRKRCVYVFTCPKALHPPALLIDPVGLWFRPEGERFIAGYSPDPDPAVDFDDFEVDLRVFEDQLWPMLARRVPAFEQARLTAAWAGHYDYNTFDQNAFVGPARPGSALLLASGFSGHGLQHAPGIGRGLAEWIAHGEWRSLDLDPLGIGRLDRIRPEPEINVI